MRSQAVAFVLAFGVPQRRQLQASYNARFDAELMTALLSSLPVGLSARNLLIMGTSAPGEREVMAIDLSELALRNVMIRANTPAFLTSLEGAMGTPVRLVAPAAIVSRLTPTPSPPPTPPIQSVETAVNVAGGGGLNDTMIWVIVVAVLVAVILLGCLAAYVMVQRNKRLAANGLVQVGRATIRREPSPPVGVVTTGPIEGRAAAAAEPTAADVSLNDVRMIELGMAMERVQQARSSPRSHSEIGVPIGGSGSPATRTVNVDAVQRAQEALSRQNSTTAGEDSPSEEHSSATIKALAMRVIDDARVIAETLSPRPSRDPLASPTREHSIGASAASSTLTPTQPTPPALHRGGSDSYDSPRAKAALAETLD